MDKWKLRYKELIWAMMSHPEIKKAFLRYDEEMTRKWIKEVENGKRNNNNR